jgi:Zn-dependent protease with chaperone function
MKRASHGLAGLLLALLLPACCGAAPLIDLPQYPQIDENALERYALRTLNQREAQARGAGELGCVHYCDLLERAFARVAAAAREQGEGARAIAWQLTVTTTRGESALSLPGGHIVISEDMIAKYHLSEAELAFVIAHEAAHILLNHEAETLDYLQATLLPHGVQRSVWDLYAELDYDAGAMLRIESVMQQSEMEADFTGMLLGAEAGYPPAQMLSALKKIGAGGKHGDAIIHTHPDMLQRLQHLAGILPMAQRVLAMSSRHPAGRGAGVFER